MHQCQVHFGRLVALQPVVYVACTQVAPKQPLTDLNINTCSILKSIEFPHLSATASSNSGDDIKDTQLSSSTQQQSPSKPLQVLLLERNKALQSENTALKVANTELQGRTRTNYH